MQKMSASWKEQNFPSRVVMSNIIFLWQSFDRHCTCDGQGMDRPCTQTDFWQTSDKDWTEIGFCVQCLSKVCLTTRGEGVPKLHNSTTFNLQMIFSVIFQSDGEDELKKRQLMELAIINGTYRDSQSKSSTSRKPTKNTKIICFSPVNNLSLT